MKDIKIGFLSPGESVDINAVGSYIRLAQADSPVKVIAINTEKSTAAFNTTIKPNGDRKVSDTFNRWTITNIGILSQKIVVTIGHGKATENEIFLSSTSSVNMVNKSNAGNSFSFTSNLGFASGAYSLGLLWNPPNSGYSLEVSKIAMRPALSGNQNYVLWAVNSNSQYTMGSNLSTSILSNKIMNGAMPKKAEVGYYKGLAVGVRIQEFAAGYYEPSEKNYNEEKIVIPEGNGLAISRDVAQDSYFQLDFTEVGI